jgi:hypothetical protein
MLRPLLSAALVLALSAITAGEGPAKKAEPVRGTIKKVDPSAGRLHVTVEGKSALPERDFTLGPATRFLFLSPGPRRAVTGKAAYKDARLREGARVEVLADGKGRATEVRVGTPARE